MLLQFFALSSSFGFQVNTYSLLTLLVRFISGSLFSKCDWSFVCVLIDQGEGMKRSAAARELQGFTPLRNLQVSSSIPVGIYWLHLAPESFLLLFSFCQEYYRSLIWHERKWCSRIGNFYNRGFKFCPGGFRLWCRMAFRYNLFWIVVVICIFLWLLEFLSRLFEEPVSCDIESQHSFGMCSLMNLARSVHSLNM